MHLEKSLNVRNASKSFLWCTSPFNPVGSSWSSWLVLRAACRREEGCWGRAHKHGAIGHHEKERAALQLHGSPCWCPSMRPWSALSAGEVFSWRLCFLFGSAARCLPSDLVYEMMCQTWCLFTAAFLLQIPKGNTLRSPGGNFPISTFLSWFLPSAGILWGPQGKSQVRINELKNKQDLN